MSKLSQMYGYWKDSIKTSMKRYDENLEKSLTHLQDFYNTVLKDYIIDWSKYFENQAFRHSLRKKIESFFGKSEINFVAIDGTCIKDEGSNFITFFAGAYGARGKIIIKHEGEKIKYERWDFARDVTMMAQIPVHRDWEDQEKEPLDDATKIRCLAIPTNIEIIIDNKQSISIGIGSNLPMVGAEAFLLDEELTNRMRYGEIKEFGFSNENVIDQKKLIDIFNRPNDKVLIMLQSHDPDELRNLAYQIGMAIFEDRRRSGKIDPVVSFIFDEADEFIPQDAKDS